jgi:hypothetical protein
MAVRPGSDCPWAAQEAVNGRRPAWPAWPAWDGVTMGGRLQLTEPRPDPASAHARIDVERVGGEPGTRSLRPTRPFGVSIATSVAAAAGADRCLNPPYSLGETLGIGSESSAFVGPDSCPQPLPGRTLGSRPRTKKGPKPRGSRPSS